MGQRRYREIRYDAGVGRISDVVVRSWIETFSLLKFWDWDE